MNLGVDFNTWMFVFLRVSAFLLVLPFFSMVNFPVIMRTALSALTAWLLAQNLPAYSGVPLSMVALVSIMAQEVCVGLLLGFVARMVFFAVDLAGGIVATEIGLNTGAIMNPMSHMSSPVPGLILFFLAAVVMLSLDLHHWVLLSFQRSYEVLPIGSTHLNASLLTELMSQIAHLFVVGLQIAAPVLAVSFIVTVVFGMLSRAAPQTDVFVLSFTFRVAGGLAVLGLTLQLTAQYVMNYFHRLPDDLLRMAQLLGAR